VIGLQGNMIGRADHNGPQGKGHTDDGDPMFTLTGTDIHAVAYDEYNDTLGGDTHHALRAGTKQSRGVMVEAAGTDIRAVAFAQNQREEVRELGDIAGALQGEPGTHQQTFIASNMVVRRLTPVECERLMGWPDDHTRYNADGTVQSDTHRYKQAGNGVATPVAKWIAQHLKAVDG